MDKQKVFDLVVAQAKTMKRQAFGSTNDMCMYRSPTGPCLIGSLIKDEHYKPNLEGNTADAAVVINALADSGIDATSQEDSDFLAQLQYCHDMLRKELVGAAFQSSLLKKLRVFATTNNLAFPK